MSLFLTRQQIAEALGTGPGVAAALLSARGVHPIDLGRGRGRGLRWYAAAVKQVAYDLHTEAQAKKQGKSHTAKKTTVRGPGPILGRSTNEIYAELTGSPPMQ